MDSELVRPLLVSSKAGASLPPVGEQVLRHAPALGQVRKRALHLLAMPPGQGGAACLGGLAEERLAMWPPRQCI
jgi:LysR family transcriptional regulator, flagellar master operon regulator